MTTNPTARQKITTAAADNGWTLKTPDDWDRLLDIDEYRRGRKYVRVQFSTRGTVVEASSDNRKFLGTGKLAQILARLAKTSNARYNTIAQEVSELPIDSMKALAWASAQQNANDTVNEGTIKRGGPEWVQLVLTTYASALDDMA